MDEQDDIDSAAQAHQEQTEQRRRECSGWEWWPAYYDADRARHRAQEAQLKALCFALDRLFR